VNFVIADQDNRFAVTGKGCHAVGEPWHQQAIVHFLTLLRDNRVVETLWQVDHTGWIRNQFAKTTDILSATSPDTGYRGGSCYGQCL
jgi:hypothetical protein